MHAMAEQLQLRIANSRPWLGMGSKMNNILKKLLLGFFVVALVKLHSYPAFSGEMVFEVRGTGGNCVGCEWIAADGDITSNTPRRFLAFLRENKIEEIKLSVHLNSDGGSLFAGMALGDLIRKTGLTTQVARSRKNADYPDAYTPTPGKCLSACALAFLGGSIRLASAGEIGVHQFYDPIALRQPRVKVFDAIDLSAQQMISAIVLDYIYRMGVDAQLFSRAASTPPMSMYFPTAEELLKLRVSWNPDEFQDWAIEPYRNGIVAHSTTHSGEETVTLYCRRNGPFQVLLTGRKFSSYLKAGEPMPQPTVFGFDLESKNVRLRKVGGKDALEISMKAKILDELGLGAADNDGNLSISFDTPRYAYNLFHFELPTRGAAESFRLAARNCIN